VTSTGATFQQLHRSGTFLLVDVHDAGSAVIAERAGAVALGTSSAGHAYSMGRRDGEGDLIRRPRTSCSVESDTAPGSNYCDKHAAAL